MSKDELPPWAKDLMRSDQDRLSWIPSERATGPYMWAAQYLGEELTKEAAERRIALDRYRAFLRLHYLIKHPEADLGVNLDSALRAFADGFFSRGKVFYPERWSKIEGRFAERRRSEESSSSDAWRMLVEPAVLTACRAVPDRLKMRDLFTFLRKETRKAIERDLLDGQTLDQRNTYDSIPASDFETPADEGEGRDSVEESMAEEGPLIGGLTRLEAAAFIQQIVGELSVAEAKLLYLDAMGHTSKEIAEEMGTSPGAVRTRMSRLRKRIRDRHGL